MHKLTPWERRILGEYAEPIEPREGEKGGAMDKLLRNLECALRLARGRPMVVDLVAAGSWVKELVNSYSHGCTQLAQALADFRRVAAILKETECAATVDKEA